jgi:DNA-binding MarR family transcriptional regulator
MADGGTRPIVSADIFTETSLPHFAARVASQARRRLRRTLVQNDLTELGWLALTGLLEYEGCGVTDLARLCGIRQPTMTKILDQLEAAKLVERKGGCDDRRRAAVVLTLRGRMLAQKTVREWRAEQADMLAKLSPRERNALGRVFRAMPKMGAVE